MSMAINKARSTGVVAADPVSRIKRVQFNHDPFEADGETPKTPTLTVVVDFFKSQADLDSGGSAFEQKSYQVDEPAAIENLINAELKTLTDFDAAV